MEEMNLFDNFNVKQFIGRVNRQKRILQSLFPLSDKELDSYNKAQRIREVYTSNAIEGNSFSLGDTYYLLNTGICPQGKSLKECNEVNNLNKAIEYLEKCISMNLDIDKEFILKLHYIVTNGIVDDEDCGKYRTVRNWIGGASITTSSPQAVPVHVDKLLKWYMQEKDKLPVIELAVKFSYRFVCIHPFVDGNGRVSRLLMNFILKKNNYLPVLIDPKLNKQTYYSALENYNKVKDIYWCDDLIKFICIQLEEEYKKFLEELED